MAVLSSAADGGTAQKVASLTWSEETIEVETCGRSYWSFLQRARAIDNKQLGNVSAFTVDDEVDEEEVSEEVDFLLRDDLTPELVRELTHYEILGFEKYGNGVGDEGLKKAYRKAVLKYHPDKTGVQDGEEDEVFMAVQKAFDTLTDMTKRRAYDSSLEFDDNELEGKEVSGPTSFYKVYGPVFERNKRFAVILPAPSLGDDDTPIDEVNNFYEYWVNFESWRDFSLEGEHDVEDAHDRYEKRWMIKENDRKSKELKRKEVKRLALLVDRARAVDPRIIRERVREREAKVAAKENKEREKREREQAKMQAVEDEKRRKKEEEERLRAISRQAKAGREAHKKEMRRRKKVMKNLYSLAVAQLTIGGSGSEAGITPVGEEDMEWLKENLLLDQLNAAIAALGTEEDIKVEGLDVMKMLMERRKAELKEEEEAAEAKQRADREALVAAQLKMGSDRESRKRAWEENELSSLAKAIVKFPAGSQNRWEHISQFIAQATRAKDPFSKEDCIAKYQQLHAAPAGPQKVVAPAVAAASSSANARSAPERPSRREPREDVWSQAQQQQLETALARFPMGMDKNERWASISAAVPGKSKKQCVERFKFVKTQLLAKKKAEKKAAGAAAANGGAEAAAAKK
ncbi:unnamed protein product [Ectocarpus sp. CCAP 1310/34]|nr:unnamed protein product [Ectocarpus sp. CCAP 1310/34]